MEAVVIVQWICLRLPTILQPWIRIRSTPNRLFSICIIEILMKKDENKQKRGRALPWVFDQRTLTKGRSITVWMTSCTTDLNSTKQVKLCWFCISKAAESKENKHGVFRIVILPLKLVFSVQPQLVLYFNLYGCNWCFLYLLLYDC